MKSTKTIESYKNTAVAKDRATEKQARSKFADPTSIKNQNVKDQPEDSKGTPWDFRCPQYDQRGSNFINAGTHYGVGHKQPVGHDGNPKQYSEVMPMTRHDTQQNDDLG